MMHVIIEIWRVWWLISLLYCFFSKLDCDKRFVLKFFIICLFKCYYKQNIKHCNLLLNFFFPESLTSSYSICWIMVISIGDQHLQTSQQSQDNARTNITENYDIWWNCAVAEIRMYKCICCSLNLEKSQEP